MRVKILKLAKNSLQGRKLFEKWLNKSDTDLAFGFQEEGI